MSESTGLNRSQIRYLSATLGRVDELLTQAEQIMQSAGSASPFREYADDTTPIQRKVTRDYVARLRETMRRQLDDLDVPRPVPSGGALWAARNAVSFAGITLAELESERMRRYGQLPDAAAQKIDTMVAELRSALGELDAYLAQGSGTDLQARLQQLGETSDEARLLRELDRIVTTHGLVEFRNALTMLLERMEDATLEVGVFGRVSSGKSSLLNHLLDIDCLPVGVTPVTAVPTRIAYGEPPRAVVEFADRRSRTVELDELPALATEQQNPGNEKHVARIRVQVPAPRLREGITFVDTPGLGSLAIAGAEETVAYLPRCDLGIVLVDAASTLTAEDLRVVEAVYRAGATPMVLVSKVDLLQDADRARVVEYVRAELRAELGAEPSVDAVSVAAGQERLCDDWFEARLRPKLDAHRQLRADSLRRKIGGLRETVLTALRRRTGNGTVAPIDPAELAALQERLREAPHLLESARRDARQRARAVRELAGPIVDAGAENLAETWSGGGARNVDADAALGATVTRLVTEESTALRSDVEAVRERLTGLLEEAARALPTAGVEGGEMAKPAGLPLCDAAAVTAGLALRRPAALALLGRGVLRRGIRATLRERLVPDLSPFLDAHGRRLDEWAQRSLAEIEAGFAAAAGPFTALLAERPGSVPAASGDAATGDGLEAEIRLLERWGRDDVVPDQPRDGHSDDSSPG